MPHSTSSGSQKRAPSQSRSKGARDPSVDSREPSTTEKFPDFDQSSAAYRPNIYGNGSAALPGDVWKPRRESSAHQKKWVPSLPGQPSQGHGHGRRQSMHDALRNIRARGGSVTQNAQEIADALRAPVSPTLIV